MQDVSEPSTIPGVSIHTGFPNPATDIDRQAGLNLNRLLIHNSASTFMMRIAGNDWHYFGIFNDDLAIIDRALTPQHTDLVVWWLDGDFSISEFARMRPEATVWGVVTSVIHEFRKAGNHAGQ